MWRDLVIRFGKKPLILTLALVITISGAVSGSLAWLTAATNILTNTFTIGDIKIDLEETDDGDGDEDNNSYEIILGEPIDKDPWVTVFPGSKACWLFVKIQVSDNFHTLLSFDKADGWSVLSEDANNGSYVYYRAVDEIPEDADALKFDVLLNNQVNVAKPENPNDPNDPINVAIKEIIATNNYPVMKIRAYAVQRDSAYDEIGSAAAAWAQIDEKEKQLFSLSDSTSTASTVVPAYEAPAAEETVNAGTVLSSAPQSYAERKAQQAEDGWLAFAAG